MKDNEKHLAQFRFPFPSATEIYLLYNKGKGAILVFFLKSAEFEFMPIWTLFHFKKVEASKMIWVFKQQNKIGIFWDPKSSALCFQESPGIKKIKGGETAECYESPLVSQKGIKGTSECQALL